MGRGEEGGSAEVVGCRDSTEAEVVGWGVELSAAGFEYEVAATAIELSVSPADNNKDTG